MNLKKLLSHFAPINIHHQKSAIHKSLEVTWNNGKLVLDTENTNFSYGSLEKVLRKGLLEIGFDKVRDFENILLLGVAGGSVIKTLVDEVHYKGKITGIEIDPETIELANAYFGLDKIKNLKIIIDDAQTFVKKATEKYDLIIVDVFQDNLMPPFLFEDEFAISLQKVMTIDGLILFNTITATMIEEIRNDIFVKQILSRNIEVKRFPNTEGNNELLILKNNLLVF